MAKDISKWQIASQGVNDLRFKLEEILGGFTPEEKQSLRYTQLVDSVSNNLDNAILHVTGEARRKKKFSWFSWQSASIILGSPVLVELIKLLWRSIGS